MGNRGTGTGGREHYSPAFAGAAAPHAMPSRIRTAAPSPFHFPQPHDPGYLLGLTAPLGPPTIPPMLANAVLQLEDDRPRIAPVVLRQVEDSNTATGAIFPIIFSCVMPACIWLGRL